MIDSMNNLLLNVAYKTLASRFDEKDRRLLNVTQVTRIIMKIFT